MPDTRGPWLPWCMGVLHDTPHAVEGKPSRHRSMAAGKCP